MSESYVTPAIPETHAAKPSSPPSRAPAPHFFAHSGYRCIAMSIATCII